MLQNPTGELGRAATSLELSPGRHRERPKNRSLSWNGYLTGGIGGLVVVVLLVASMVGGPQLPAGPHASDMTPDEALSEDAGPRRSSEVTQTPSPSREAAPPPVATAPDPRGAPAPRRAPGAHETVDPDWDWSREWVPDLPRVEPKWEVPEVDDLPKSPPTGRSNGRGPQADAPGQVRKAPVEREP